jgi:hypothetical protein
VGLPEWIYQRRHSKIVECKLSAEDQAALDATPKRLCVDHPLFISRETRERNVILGRCKPILIRICTLSAR